MIYIVAYLVLGFMFSLFIMGYAYQIRKQSGEVPLSWKLGAIVPFTSLVVFWLPVALFRAGVELKKMEEKDKSQGA